MKLMSHLALFGALVLGMTACSAPKAIIDGETTGYLGVVTLTIDPSTNSSNLEFVPNAAIDKAMLKFLPGLTTAVSSGSGHFVNSAFSVQNLSGMTLKNLSMVAANMGHPSGTAISSVVDSNNIPVAITDAQLKSVMPSHGMSATGVNITRADLQLFSERELSLFNTPSVVPGGTYLLNYGYVVKNSAGGTTLSGIGPSRLTNRVTVGLKVPSEAWKAYKYQLNYLLFTDSLEVKSQSAEETTTVAGQSQTSVNIAALSQVKTLFNSTYPGENRLNVCNVRNSGPAGSLLATYLGPQIPVNPGALDACNFGVGGKLLVNASSGEAHDVAIDQNNKIVLAGGQGGQDSFTIIRLNPNGKPDTTFGASASGKVVVSMGSVSGAQALEIDENHKIVAAGYAVNSGQYDFVIVRFNPNGSLDTSFGVGGRVVIPAPGNDFDGVNDVVIDQNNKIIVVGDVEDGTTNDFIAIRLNQNGSLDSSFGINGRSLISMSSGSARKGVAHSVDIDQSGKIVIGGIAYSSSDIVSFAIARLNPNGGIDNTFDNDGKVLIDVSGNSQGSAALDIFIGQGNKIVAAGVVASNTNSGDFAVVRLNPDGTLDNTFGMNGDGKTIVDISDGTNWFEVANGLAIDQNNNIIAAGYGVTASGDIDFAALRLNPNGIPDGSFGVNGKSLIPVSSVGTFDLGNAVAIDKDNKIVIVGAGFDGIGSKFAVARVLP
jgi:uncharacterized delta-60 repeat protein